MAKSAWEARVGTLIDPRFHPEFVWTYKPYDSAMYGGQPRIDWLAADYAGQFWMIEVKTLSPERKSLNLLSDVSDGQAQALDALNTSVWGTTLLAVGQGKTLYVFDWRDVGCRRVVSASKTYLLKMTEALQSYVWSPTNFRAADLCQEVMEHRSGKVGPAAVGAILAGGASPPGTPVTVTGSKPFLPDALRLPLPSTLRRPVSRRTMRKKLLSGPLLSKSPE